jgi:ABC-2 type transport system permease protein
MVNFIIKLIAPFRRFIEMLGADYDQFILILKIKLTLDNRRVSALSKKPQNEQKNMMLWQAFTQIFIGFFFGMFVAIIKSPFTFFYLSHTFLMVMMAMMIISEFTTILFDTTENVIIQPLPIKGNTLSLARNAHVFLYLAFMAFNLSVVTIIVSITKFGILAAGVYVFTIFLNVLFTLFLANILYLGILRIAKGEQLKNLLMYFQIVMAILFMGGYQFGIKMIDKTNILNMELPIHWYTYLLPPAFFSGFTVAITLPSEGFQGYIFIIEALLIPFLAIYFTGKFLTPIFSRKLMELEQSDRSSDVKTESTRKSLWYMLMAKIFVFDKEEKASFNLMWKMTGRERLFKQTILPAFGYIIIIIVINFMNQKGGIQKALQGNTYLFILYSFIMIAGTMPGALLTGNNKTTSWIFKSLPYKSPAPFFRGSIKAAFAKFFIPGYIVISSIIVGFWGIKVIPDVIIALLAIYVLTLVLYYLQTPSFPFSMEKSAVQGGMAGMKMMGVILMGVIAGFGHQSISHLFPGSNLILIPIYSAAIWFVNRRYAVNTLTWRTVDRVNRY